MLSQSMGRRDDQIARVEALAMIELRPYQRAAVDAIYDAFRAGIRAPLIVMPTASGRLSRKIIRLCCGFGRRPRSPSIARDLSPAICPARSCSVAFNRCMIKPSSCSMLIWLFVMSVTLFHHRVRVCTESS